MMAKHTQTLAASLVPPVYIVSLFLWWGLLYVFLVPGMIGCGMVLNFPLIERRPALSSSHLKCRQKATHISWGAAVTYFVDWRSGACNCCWQLTGCKVCRGCAYNVLQAGTVCSLKLRLPKCLFKDTNVCCFCKNEKIIYRFCKCLYFFPNKANCVLWARFI